MAMEPQLEGNAYIDRDYTFVAHIGKGVFGKICSVAKGSKTFAMKVLENFQTASVNEQGELQEIANLQKLRNIRNVLCFVESFPEEGLTKRYIVTEYCEHGDLEKVLDPTHAMLVSDRFIAIVMTQLCCGIKEIHSNNVIHNDITLKNIFVHSEGVIKIGDFGRSNELVENVQNSPMCYSSDMLAVGVLLLELAESPQRTRLTASHYLMTLILKLRNHDAGLRPTAAKAYPVFRKIERKLRSSEGDLEAVPAVPRTDAVSKIINSWDHWISPNGDDDDDDDDGNDNVNDYLKRLVERSFSR